MRSRVRRLAHVRGLVARLLVLLAAFVLPLARTDAAGAPTSIGAVVAEWVTGKVKLVRLTASDDGYTGTTVSFLSGFENPVPVVLDSPCALFRGDWTSGKVYRVTA